MGLPFKSLLGRFLGLDQANGDLVADGRRWLAAPSARFVDCTASTLTVTADLHAEKTVTLNRAAGITVTLPAASGSGATYKFYVGTTVTSNNIVIQVASSSDVMNGQVLTAGDSAAASWPAGTTSDTITLNGSTKGGIVGDLITLVDVASGVWAVTGFTSSSGTEATPFSAAV